MKKTSRYPCSHPGCKEWTFSEYSTNKEQREAFEHRKTWKCLRHSSPEKTLSTTNLVRESTSIVIQKDGGKFFDGSFGLLTGHGFRAFASDFPDGTKLKVTAQILLPSPPRICGACKCEVDHNGCGCNPHDA